MRQVTCKYLLLANVLVVLVHGYRNVTVEKMTEAYGLSKGPHWDHRTQKLYFVDIYDQYIRRLDYFTGEVYSAYIEHGPVGVAVPVDDTVDRMAAGSGSDLILVTWDGEENEKNASYEVLCPLDTNYKEQTRINDGKVDSSGRFWIGTMDNEVKGQIAANKGTLYCINEDLKPKRKVTPVSISGLAWNKEDDTFYYIDSLMRTIVEYDYNPNTGTISNKRVVFDLSTTNLPSSAVPGGMTIDTDGNLWVALFGGHHVINVNPKTGKLLRKIKIPVENVTSVTFGGPLLDILFVTTSGYNLSAEQQEATPDAGAVFAVKDLGVRGVLANSFIMKE